MVCGGGHAALAKGDEGIEERFVGEGGEAGEGVGKQRGPRGLAVGGPALVGEALGAGGGIDLDEPVFDGIEDREDAGLGEVAIPGVIDAEAPRELRTNGRSEREPNAPQTPETA